MFQVFHRGRKFLNVLCLFFRLFSYELTLACWAWFFSINCHSSYWQHKCNSNCHQSCVSWANKAHRGWLSLHWRSIWWHDYYYQSTGCCHLWEGPSLRKTLVFFFLNKLMLFDSPISPFFFLEGEGGGCGWVGWVVKITTMNIELSWNIADLDWIFRWLIWSLIKGT